jgi:hypothetical protein
VEEELRRWEQDLYAGQPPFYFRRQTEDSYPMHCQRGLDWQQRVVLDHRFASSAEDRLDLEGVVECRQIDHR